VRPILGCPSRFWHFTEILGCPSRFGLFTVTRDHRREWRARALRARRARGARVRVRPRPHLGGPVQAATSRRRPGGGRHPAFKVHPLKPMMLKHAVILTEDLLANDTIIDEGLRAFVAIVKDLGWQYGYVGASIKKRLLGPVKLERSIPVKGTQRRKCLPAPSPNITPPFVSNLLNFCVQFVTTGSLALYRRCNSRLYNSQCLQKGGDVFRRPPSPSPPSPPLPP